MCMCIWKIFLVIFIFKRIKWNELEARRIYIIILNFYIKFV